MSSIGTADNPLRVAIVGSGPSGCYAAGHLLKQKDLTVEIDMFDSLPTPWGLVRAGVAPDHPNIKSVTRVFEKTAANPLFRFFGNVEIGEDIPHEDLTAHYHAIVYAVGAQTDKRMRVPGEDLPGSWAATEFVAWYTSSSAGGAGRRRRRSRTPSCSSSASCPRRTSSSIPPR
jgi:ferredoxin--NADP+ reductase